MLNVVVALRPRPMSVAAATFIHSLVEDRSPWAGDSRFCFRAGSPGCSRLLALTVLFAGLFQAPVVAQFGSGAADNSSGVYGRLVDESGASIIGARVVLRRVGGAKLAVPFDPFSRVTETGGLFRFTKIPSGIYQMCPSVAGSSFVDPCEWFDNPPAVALAIGQTNTGVTVVMQRGKMLNVRIDDDDKKLKSNQGNGNGNQKKNQDL